MSRRDERDALEDLVRAAEAVGLTASVGREAGAGSAHDVVLTLPDGRSVPLRVASASLVSADSASGQVSRWSRALSAGEQGVVVADRITADARDDLTRAGWSWLDRRGHLRLSGPGVFVSADVPVPVGPGTGRAGLRGASVVRELAALLLLDPATKIGVRAAAATLSRAPSSISEAFAALRSAGLVHADRMPVVPDLFRELAEHWSPEAYDVARLPGPGDGRDDAALRLGLADVESTAGWALTDTVAAVAYGAPVASRVDHPPDFYVPDRSTLRRAVTTLGAPAVSSSRAGRVHLAPVALVCTRRVDLAQRTGQVWPVAHPLFVALDLARDPGRGREVLDAWTPEGPWARVW